MYTVHTPYHWFTFVGCSMRLCTYSVYFEANDYCPVVSKILQERMRPWRWGNSLNFSIALPHCHNATLPHWTLSSSSTALYWTCLTAKWRLLSRNWEMTQSVVSLSFFETATNQIHHSTLKQLQWGSSGGTLWVTSVRILVGHRWGRQGASSMSFFSRWKTQFSRDN